MILKKDSFSSIGSDNLEASAGLIYKLLLQFNYVVIKDEQTPTIKHLVKNGNNVAEVNTIDIKAYLAENHTTYKLYTERYQKASGSRLESKMALVPEYANILDQIVDIYTAKYLFKQLPLAIRVEYLK